MGTNTPFEGDRVDDIITFRALTLKDIGNIVDIQVELIKKRLEERSLFL